MIKSIPIPLLLGKVEHYNKCPDFYSCLGTVPQLSGFRLTPLTAKGLPCRRCGAWRLPYTLNRKGSPLSAVRCVAVAFAVSVLECPKRKDSRFVGCLCVGGMRFYFVGVSPIARAFVCIACTVLHTLSCLIPRYVAIALYPYPL